jgi:hypothetical protein
MEDFFFLFVIVGAVVCGLVGAVIGNTRKMAWPGWWCGFLLGPIGWIIVLLLPKSAPAEKERTPGSPTKRTRTVPVKADPFEVWEAKQQKQELGKD